MNFGQTGFGASKNSFATGPTGFGSATAGSFGAGAFGSTAKPSTSFSIVPGANPSTPSMFGSTKPATFGAPTSGGFSGAAFGTTTAASNPFGGTSGFGATNSTVSFGNSQQATFGASQPVTAFGSQPSNNFSTQQTGTFGVQQQPNAFGAQQSGFGSQTGSSFGSTAFGSSTQSSLSTGAFGAAKPSNPAFGATTMGTGFGTQPNLFGAAPASNPIFGGTQAATTTAPAFGAVSGAMFGGNTTATTFGANAFNSGNTSSNSFAFGGQPTSTGIVSNGFGQASTNSTFNTQSSIGSTSGTGNPPFNPTTITENNSKPGAQSGSFQLQAISGMDAFKNKSFEELHMEDILKGNTGGQTAGFGASQTSGGFFSSMTTPPKTNAFQPAQPTSNVFGAGFGTTAQQQTTSAPLFGTTQSTGFPTSTPVFSAPTGLGSSSFTVPGATGFGTSNSLSGSFMQPPSTQQSSILSPAKSTFTMSSFSSTPTVPTSSTFSLANPSTTTFSGFPSQQQGTGMNSFLPGGSTTTVGFPTFSSQPPAQPVQPATTSQVVVPSAPTTPSIDQKIDLLIKKRGEVSTSKKEQEATQSIKSPSIIFAGLDIGRTKSSTRSSPASYAKILPRGLRANAETPSMKVATPISSAELIGSPNFMSPTANIPMSSSKKLILSSCATPSLAGDYADLPPLSSLKPPKPPAAAAAAEKQLGLNPKITDQRTPGSSSARLDEAIHSEKTGLTPAAQSTPYGDFDAKKNKPISSMQPSPDKKLSFSSPSAHNKNLNLARSCAPTLTKEGYYTTPDIHILKSMTAEDLSHLRFFAIFRPNIGKIEWEGAVDIRNLDLDKIVTINQNDVLVYEGMEEPPEGTELNRPAIITFENVFPKKSSAVPQEKKLRDFCANNDSEFLHYDSSSGEFKFRVKHFSRYGLQDSDDDDEDPAQESSERAATEKKGADLTKTNEVPEELLEPILSSAASLKRVVPVDVKANLKRLKTILLKENVCANIDASAAPRNVAQTHPLPTMPIELEPSSKTIPVSFSVDSDKEISVDAKKVQSKRPQPAKRAFFPPQECPSVRLLLEIKAKFLGLHHADAGSFTKPLSAHLAGKQKGIENYALAMGRSFRVGWSRDGKIVHSGRLTSAASDSKLGDAHRISVEAIDTLTWQKKKNMSTTETASVIDRSMELILSASDAVAIPAIDGLFAPAWAVSSLNPDQIRSYNRFAVLVKSLKATYSIYSAQKSHADYFAFMALWLVDATVGQEKVAVETVPAEFDYMPPYEFRETAPEHWERRRVAVSKWLEALTAAVTEAGTDSSLDSAYKRAFELLTSHRIAESVACLEDSGAFRMACLVSQVGSDPCSVWLLRRQLELWDTMAAGALGTFPKTVLRLYLLLSAKIAVDTSASTDSILLGLGWVKCLAVLFWYFGHSESEEIGSLSAALDKFRDLLATGAVDPPTSQFFHESDHFGANVEYPIVKNGLFSLLQLLYPSESFLGAFESSEAGMALQLTEVLRTEGFTRDRLDHRITYIISILLEGMGFLPGDSFLGSVNKHNMIFQLLSLGLWQWAGFVALQLPDAADREVVLKDILARWATDISPSAVEFLHSRLFVPMEWIYEAQALLCVYKRDYERQYALAYSARLFPLAARALCMHLAPKVFLQNHGQRMALLNQVSAVVGARESSLDRTSHDSLWLDVADVIRLHLEIQDAAQHAKEDLENAMEDENRINKEIYDSTKTLLERLSALHKRGLDLQLEGESFQIMLKDIGSYAYSLLSTIELAQGRCVLSSCYAFSKEILDHAPVLPLALSETVLLGNYNLLVNAADALEPVSIAAQ